MTDSHVMNERQMLENGRSELPTSKIPVLPVPSYKKKNRGQKRKTLCYTDYDQATGEDVVMQNAASLTWPGGTTSSVVHLESEAYVKRCVRESVTYEEPAPLLVRGRYYNNQFAGNHTHPGNWMHALASRPPNPPVFLPEHQVSHSPTAYEDPTVVASEKKEIFKKPNRQQIYKAANKQQALTPKQQKKREKRRRYRELQRKKQEEEGKEPVKKLCKYFQAGNCNKGSDCIFSHDCQVIKKPELCKFYLLSTCTKDLACPYYHGDWPCKFFHRFKFCMNGDSCKFSHAPLTEESHKLLEKAVQSGGASSAGKAGEQLSSDVAKENCLSNGNFQPAVVYNASIMPLYNVATTSQQQVNSQSVYQPSQLATGSQWSTDASAAAGVSMTLQQKVYHLTPIEFEHPVIRQLPAYIDMCDPRWSTDPRIQPSIRPTAIAPVSEHSFYSPILANGQQSSGGVATENCLSNKNFSAADGLSVKSSHCGQSCPIPRESLPDMLCKPETSPIVAVLKQESFSIGAVKQEPIEASIAVKPQPAEAIYAVKSEPNEAKSNTESSPPAAKHIVSWLTVNKAENFPIGAVKSEPNEAGSNTALEPSATRHMFQHNFSWLTVNKPENLLVGAVKPQPVEASNAVQPEPVEAINAVKLEPNEAKSNNESATPAARHIFQHNVSWLTAVRSSGVQKLSRAKNGGSN